MDRLIEERGNERGVEGGGREREIPDKREAKPEAG